MTVSPVSRLGPRTVEEDIENPVNSFGCVVFLTRAVKDPGENHALDEQGSERKVKVLSERAIGDQFFKDGEHRLAKRPVVLNLRLDIPGQPPTQQCFGIWSD